MTALWLLAGLFVAGHLVWGPRWMVDGTRGIWAAWADLFGRVHRRRPPVHAVTADEAVRVANLGIEAAETARQHLDWGLTNSSAALAEAARIHAARARELAAQVHRQIAEEKP